MSFQLQFMISASIGFRVQGLGFRFSVCSPPTPLLRSKDFTILIENSSYWCFVRIPI